MQDNEDLKRSNLGVAFMYRCEKCGKEKLKYKSNNEINNDFFDILARVTVMVTLFAYIKTPTKV